MSTSNDFIVTAEHWHGMRNLRGKDYCVPGARAFAVRFNLDFDKFVREGLPASQLLATGQQVMIDLVEFARQEEQRRG